MVTGSKKMSMPAEMFLLRERRARSPTAADHTTACAAARDAHELRPLSARLTAPMQVQAPFGRESR